MRKQIAFSTLLLALLPLFLCCCIPAPSDSEVSTENEKDETPAEVVDTDSASSGSGASSKPLEADKNPAQPIKRKENRVESFVFSPQRTYLNSRIRESSILEADMKQFFVSREWISREGEYKTKGQLAGFKSNKVGIKLESGKTISVDLPSLSDKDRQFVRKFNRFEKRRSALCGQSTFEEFRKEEAERLREADRAEQYREWQAKQTAKADAARKERENKRIRSLNVTRDGFHKIEMGMSYKKVVSIIGYPNEELSRTDLGGFETVMFMWRQPGTLGGNCNITFQNGKVSLKAQFGLK